MSLDPVVLFEGPEWQKPLFAALERRGFRFGKYDPKHATFDPAELRARSLYSNQDEPAYRGVSARAV